MLNLSFHISNFHGKFSDMLTTKATSMNRIRFSVAPNMRFFCKVFFSHVHADLLLVRDTFFYASVKKLVNLVKCYGLLLWRIQVTNGKK